MREVPAAETPAVQVPHVVSSYFAQGANYATLRPEGSGDFLLIYTVGGAGYFRQPGTELALAVGDLLLVHPRAYSEYGTAAELWQLHWVHFLPRQGWERHLALPPAGEGLGLLHVPDEAHRARLVRTFQRLHCDLNRRDAWSRDLGLNGIEALLLLAHRAAGSRSDLDSRVQRVLDLLQSEPAASWTVASMAREAHLSPSRFAHLFRHETGEAPLQLLTKLRVRKAMELLRTTAEPVGVIAEAVGFLSRHYFARQFHHHTGLSPRDYRRRTRGT